MNSEIVSALIGGGLIGLAGLILLMSQGRVMGISGILSNVFKAKAWEFKWRVLFLVGMVLGAFFIEPLGYTIASVEVDRPMVLVGVGGFLVGFGTMIGNGCTSGHGVCGVSRFSKRSIIATLFFMGTAIAVNLLVNLIGGA